MQLAHPVYRLCSILNSWPLLDPDACYNMKHATKHLEPILKERIGKEREGGGIPDRRWAGKPVCIFLSWIVNDRKAALNPDDIMVAEQG